MAFFSCDSGAPECFVAAGVTMSQCHTVTRGGGCVISVTRADSATPKITKSQNHAITGGGVCDKCYFVVISVISATGCDKEIKEVKEIKEIKDDALISLNSLNSLNSLTAPYSA